MDLLLSSRGDSRSLPLRERVGLEERLTKESNGTRSTISATMVGSFPPLKGISSYCKHLLISLCREVELSFISFRRLYPSFLYPGGSDSQGEDTMEESMCNIRYDLHGYDPLSWVRVGSRLEGDVLHVQWWSYLLFPCMFTLMVFARIKRIPIVTTIHNVSMHENRFLGSLFNRLAIHIPDEIIVHTPSNKEEMFRSFGNEKPVSVIPHGVLKPGDDGVDRGYARETLGIEREAKVVLFFGNIRPYKGLDVLIQAMGEVIASEPDALLLIAEQP
jgi:glycosyltransferase involved in cell wall biosynthesis